MADDRKKKSSRPMLLLGALVVAVVAAGLIGWARPSTPVLGPAVTSIREMVNK